MGKAKTLGAALKRLFDDQTEHHPVVSPTDQSLGLTGNERIVVHAGAVEGQPTFPA